MQQLLARVLMASLFIGAAWAKAMNLTGTTAYFGRLGLPAPNVMALVAICFEVLCGVLLVIGFRTRLVALALAVFVATATFIAHRFWQMDAAQFGNQMNHFLKNLAIVGGLIYIAQFGAGRTSVDGA